MGKPQMGTYNCITEESTIQDGSQSRYKIKDGTGKCSDKRERQGGLVHKQAHIHAHKHT